MVKGVRLQAMKIVRYYANSCFDWLISRQQSDNPLREATSILSGNTKDLRLSILRISTVLETPGTTVDSEPG